MPSIEERLSRYANDLDAATAQQINGAVSTERSKSKPSRGWTGITVGLAAATVTVVGLGFLATQRDQPVAPLASSPAPTTIAGEAATNPGTMPSTPSAGGLIDVPQMDSDVYRPPWDPIAVAPGTIGWFEFGDGVPASVADLEPVEYAADDDVRAGFFRCLDWTISDEAPTCIQLTGGNGVEHNTYGDRLGLGVALGSSTAREQLWLQAQGSLWGYEEVAEAPEPTIISFGSTEAVSYRNGDHAYIAWEHAPGVVVWLQSRGLDDTELATVAAGVRPAELPSELPVLISLNDPQPVPSGPGSNSEEQSVKLGFLDGHACVGIVMWEQCASTSGPAIFSSSDGETVAAIASTGSDVLLDIDLGTGDERIEMDPTGFGFDLAVFDAGGRPIESAQLVTPTGDIVGEAVSPTVSDDGMNEADDPVGCGFYSVAVGDSKASIAERFGTTIDDIDSINQTTDSTFDVGTVIEIPCSVDMISGTQNDPFDSGPITAFLPTNASNVVTIVDEPQIKIDAKVQRVGRTDQDEYCLAINWAGRESDFDTEVGNRCFGPDAINNQRDIGNGAGLGGPVQVVDSMDGTQVLVVGAVPDAVTNIRTDSGENIAPIHNIWWNVIDSGELVTYEITFSDGSTAKLTAG